MKKYETTSLLLGLLILGSFGLVEGAKGAESSSDCDLNLPDGVCLFGGKKTILSDAVPNGLVGYWNFDSAGGLDSSGNSNNVVTDITYATGMGGFGFSALAGSSQYVQIPDISSLTTQCYSYTFWAFLFSEDASDITGQLRWCPILYKGYEDDQGDVSRGPALFYDRVDHYLRIFVTTSDTADYPSGEYLTSNARVIPGKWTHIGVIRTGTTTKLYVNGILDTTVVTIGSTVTNTYPIYVGNVPWRTEECQIQGYYDDLRVYNRELDETEIEAEAAPALGIYYPAFIQLGCLNCQLEQAVESCGDGYHICTTIEVHSAAYTIAKNLGWIDWDTRIWSFSDLEATYNASQASLTGIGLCCASV